MASGYTTKQAEATVIIGDQSYTTPGIHSISVKRVRGELTAKASCSFYTSESEGDGLSGGMSIQIQWYGASIFSGYVRRVTASPSFRCAGEVIVSVQAEDKMYRIANKRINRRQKLNGLGPIAFITSIHHRPFVGFDDPQSVDNVTGGYSPFQIWGPTPGSINSMFVQGVNSTVGDLHSLMLSSDRVLNRGGRRGGGGFFLHDHSSLDISGPHAGGPAKAVYGIK